MPLKVALGESIIDTRPRFERRARWPIWLMGRQNWGASTLPYVVTQHGGRNVRCSIAAGVVRTAALAMTVLDRKVSSSGIS